MGYVLATVLAALLLAPLEQGPGTTLRLHVVDGQRAPVALLRVTLEDAEGASHTVITDAAGEAVVGPLPGTIVFVRAAQLARRLDLTVEPTTATEGLRLGLIPQQERTVRLIVDGGLLFLDPEMLFPAEPPTADASEGAALPTAVQSVAASLTPAPFPSSAAATPTTARASASARAPAVAARTSPQAAASVEPVTARAPSRVLIVGLVAVVASTFVVLIGSIIVRRHP